MSAETKTPTYEKPKKSLKRRAIGAGALITAASALAGLAASPAHAAERTPKRIPEKKLVQPKSESTPSPEILQQLKASTLELAWRPRVDLGGDPNAPWNISCTVVKESVPGQTEAEEVTTSAHCFVEATGSKSGAFTNPNAPQDKAENYTNVGSFEYAILDPQAPLNIRVANPIGIVDGISISTDTKDAAMLHVIPTKWQEGSAVRNFENIPAVPMGGLTEELEPGTKVALVGVPQASNFNIVMGIGTYVGRVSYWEDPVKDGLTTRRIYRQLDLVEVDPDVPEQDKCNFGSSGSEFMTSSGRASGKLSIRLSAGSGPNHTFQLLDSPAANQYWRPIWENQLKINLGDNLLCGYTVYDSSTPSDLFEGFFKFPPGVSTASPPAGISTSTIPRK